MFSTLAVIGGLVVAAIIIRLSGLEEITFGGFRIRFGGNAKQPKQIEK